MINIKYFILSVSILILSLSTSINITLASSDELLAHKVEKGKKHIHGSHLECPLPMSVEDIIKCSLRFHPNIKKGKLDIVVLEQFIEKSSQLINPTISSRYVKGMTNGKKTSELETSLSFTLELGGKRSSRKEFATARKKKALASYELIKSKIKMDTILNLYRLKQVSEEKILLNETLTAFSKIISQLKKRPRLTAEQEASLTTFEFAFEETKINHSEIYEEERKLEHYFHVSTGHALHEIEPFLPKMPKKWPKIRREKRKNTFSPEIKRLKSLSNIAVKELVLQNSEAWPDLKIGPSIAIEKEGSIENKMIGINLHIPIPLFHVNGGGKSLARSKLIKSQKNIELTESEENHERFEQFKVYENAVNILNKTMKKNLVEKKHKRIEKLYLRGVVSSSVYLDSLKQKLSYLKSRNNRELTAINSLWHIYNYDGKIFEEKI
jgi:outer membrane protein, heavy metal efflux system